MSASSDKFEKDVAMHIAKTTKYKKTTRPSVGTDYADVLISDGTSDGVYMEVKMNHTDNLGNPRIFYKNGKWQTTYSTPLAKYVVDLINANQQAKTFISKISKFTGIPPSKLYLPTTKSGLKEPGAVPLNVMVNFVEQPGMNRYIFSENIGSKMGKIVTDHYIKGKAEPAYYLQAGDDFYKLSNKDPLGLAMDVPLFSGEGDMKVRISTRSEFYEIQAEVKVSKMISSKYSMHPNTKKLNPFNN